MSTSQDVVTRRLDLAARNIDLLTALVESSTATNGWLSLGIELGQWLSREKLDRNDLAECLGRANSVAHPNRVGQSYLHDIVEEASHPVLPLILQPSGAIGMWLTRDPELSWLVTTTTCLYQFFREDDVVNRISCLLTPPKAVSHENLYRVRHFSRLQTKGVVRKIVSSIWYNVVNSKKLDLSLPESLHDVCKKGHFTSTDGLEMIIQALSSTKGNIMIHSNHILTDLTLWLVHHFNGDLMVTVSGKILFREILGENPQKLEIRIKRQCPGNGSCGSTTISDPMHKYEIFDIVGDRFTKLSSGHEKQAESDYEPQTRQMLYEFGILRCMVEKKLEINKSWIRGSAQHIMRWLLGLELLPPPPHFKIAFSVALEAQSAPRQAPSLKIIDIMKRSPGILNVSWGNVPLTTPVYSAPAGDDMDIDDPAHPYRGSKPLYGRRTEHHDFKRLVLYFPILQDLLRKIQPSCNCISCNDEFTNPKDMELKAGCLLNKVLVQVAVLLAHGIADCFGVDDRSAKTNPENLAHNVSRLLLDVAEGEYVLWDIWFGIAASVLLGSDIPELQATEYFTSLCVEGSNIAAIQYGNLSAIAEWVDPSKKLTLHGCFGLTSERGRLGVVSGVHQSRQTRSVSGNFAIIRSGATEETFSNASEREASQSPLNALDEITTDDSTVIYDFILSASYVDETYTLLTRVQSQNYSRIVCLADALGCMAQNILTLSRRRDKSRSCAHAEWNMGTELVVGKDIVYTFDDLLGKWSFEQGLQEEVGRPLHNHHTFVLDDIIKINTAMALAYNSPMLVCGRHMCPRCAADELEAMEWHPEGEAHANDRFIINVSDITGGGKQRPRGYLMEH